MSGRAGRRGTDILGHVVVLDHPMDTLRSFLFPQEHLSLSPASPASVTTMIRLFMLSSVEEVFFAYVLSVRGVHSQQKIQTTALMEAKRLLKGSMGAGPKEKLFLRYFVLFSYEFAKKLGMISGNGTSLTLADSSSTVGTAFA